MTQIKIKTVLISLGLVLATPLTAQQHLGDADNKVAVICSGTSATLAIDSDTPNSVTCWYASLSSTIPLHTGAVYTTPVLTETTRYYVLVSGKSYVEEVTVKVKPRASAANISAYCPPVCYSDSLTLTLTAASSIENPVYRWYADQTSETVLAEGDSYTTPAVISSMAYFVSVSGENYCENVPNDRKAVAITVFKSATAKHITVADTAISAGSRAYLTAKSNIRDASYKWYESQTSTEPLSSGETFVTPVLTATTKFYVSVSGSEYCTNNPGNRKEVTVKMNAALHVINL